MKSLGGKRAPLSRTKLRLRYCSEDELASYLVSLSNAGIAMAGAIAGRPPSAIFQELRDKGKLAGKFVEVVWYGPDQKRLMRNDTCVSRAARLVI